MISLSILLEHAHVLDVSLRIHIQFVVAVVVEHFF